MFVLNVCPENKLRVVRSCWRLEGLLRGDNDGDEPCQRIRNWKAREKAESSWQDPESEKNERQP